MEVMSETFVPGNETRASNYSESLYEDDFTNEDTLNTDENTINTNEYSDSEGSQDLTIKDHSENEVKIVSEISKPRKSSIANNNFIYPLDEKSDEEEDSFSQISSEEEKIEVVSRPTTKMRNLFMSPVAREQSENETFSDKFFYENQEDYEQNEYKPIKLKQATGTHILRMKERIEQQLQSRRKKKLAGAVNTVADSSSGNEEEDEQVTPPHTTRVRSIASDFSED